MCWWSTLYRNIKTAVQMTDEDLKHYSIQLWVCLRGVLDMNVAHISIYCSYLNVVDLAKQHCMNHTMLVGLYIFLGTF